MVADPFSFENLHACYVACRRSKRGSASALKFELGAEELLLDLEKRLRERTYEPGRSVCFITKSPKHREIFAADFRDRIVHHVLVRHLEPFWERRFIFDSYACRKGRGTIAAVERLRSFMRTVTGNGSRRGFFLHLDIRSYFVSIHKQTLYDIVASHERNDAILWLMGKVIFHDPTGNFRRRGQLDLFAKVPPHKSLFFTGNVTGLPIGNYTSQFFSNVYLNELDQYVKHELKCIHYVRYVDDFILLDQSAARLVEWRGEIAEFLKQRLLLSLRDANAPPRPVSNGCDFLGYVTRPSHVLVRPRVVGNLTGRLARYQSSIESVKNGWRSIDMRPQVVGSLRAVLSSYLGILGHADARRLRIGVFRRHPFLNFMFRLTGGRLRLRWKPPRRFANLSSQYQWFTRRAGRAFLLFRVGTCYEFYGSRARRAARLLGLRLFIRRASGHVAAGFHASGLKRRLERTVRAEPAVFVVEETGMAAGKLRERQLARAIVRVERLGLSACR
ncbi:MAG: reverse transcriptase [Deltaproteobacteria bacterium]|nr:reverse transcriptase [Deltaproteobacteria bacterium]